MAFVGIRDLNKNTKQIIETLEETREPVILTRQGRPIATILPLDSRGLNDLVISTAPEFVASRDRAEQQFEAGQTHSLADVMTEIRSEHGDVDETAQAIHRDATSPALADSASVASATVGLPPDNSVVDIDAHGALAGLTGRSYGATFQEAIVERGRNLSKAIVEEAIAEGALNDENQPGQSERLNTISELNTRLFELAYAIKRFQAVEATMQAVAESGGAPADLVRTAARAQTDIADIASVQVRDINQSVLARGEHRGGLSVTDYVRSLRLVSSALEAAGEPTIDLTLPTAEA